MKTAKLLKKILRHARSLEGAFKTCKLKEFKNILKLAS
jgi:hypothetical protein